MRAPIGRFIIVPAALAIVLLVLAAALIAGQSLKTQFEALEFPISIDDPGTVTQPDGNIHVRGRVSTCLWEGSDDDRVNGLYTVIGNGNWDEMGNGPIWGTFVSSNGSSSGSWTGVWQGQMIDASSFRLMHSGVGHGTGEFEGLQLKYSCTYDGTVPALCEGRILDRSKE